MNTTQYGESLSPQTDSESNNETALAEVQLEQRPVDPAMSDLPPEVNAELAENAELQNAGDTVTVAAPEIVASPKKKRIRGSNPDRDSVWTRNHAICSLGVIADLMLGGYDAARSAPEPLKTITPHLKEIALTLLVVSPWILNERYLNFAGCQGLEKRGLEAHFFSWAANRVYYFFYRDHNEHPAFRSKANLKSVYLQFYDTFEIDFRGNHFISEETAGAFWISVADRVPFVAPASPAIAAPTGLASAEMNSNVAGADVTEAESIA